MSDNKCPVCGNQGIPAYHKEDVICPRCGSDLRIYKALYGVEDTSAKLENTTKSYKRLAILVPIVVALLCGIPAYYFYVGQSDLNTTIYDNNMEIAQLRDSIVCLNQQIKLKDQELNAQTEQQTYSEYVIIRNDSPWKIVRKFYGIRGDWKDLAKQIAIDNKIWDESQQEWKQIHPGQIIKVYKH